MPERHGMHFSGIHRSDIDLLNLGFDLPIEGVTELAWPPTPPPPLRGPNHVSRISDGDLVCWQATAGIYWTKYMSHLVYACGCNMISRFHQFQLAGAITHTGQLSSLPSAERTRRGGGGTGGGWSKWGT